MVGSIQSAGGCSLLAGEQKATEFWLQVGKDEVGPKSRTSLVEGGVL